MLKNKNRRNFKTIICLWKVLTFYVIKEIRHLISSPVFVLIPVPHPSLCCRGLGIQTLGCSQKTVWGCQKIIPRQVKIANIALNSFPFVRERG